MALFDRRLLAYFDDGSVPGVTLLDRIVDYQKDLAEIERELTKYQLLLGPHQVKVKARSRDGWIAAHRVSPSIKELYGQAAQDTKEQVEEDSLKPGSGRRSSGDSNKTTPRRRSTRRTVEIQPSDTSKRHSRRESKLQRDKRESVSTRRESQMKTQIQEAQPEHDDPMQRRASRASQMQVPVEQRRRISSGSLLEMPRVNASPQSRSSRSMSGEEH